jgi:cell division protein FtsB
MSRAVTRYLKIAVGLAVALFALQGGEYSTLDLYRQHNRRDELVIRVDHLQHDVDSLATLARALVSDPATQERIAREEFGMVRGNEMLYRFVRPRAP